MVMAKKLSPDVLAYLRQQRCQGRQNRRQAVAGDNDGRGTFGTSEKGPA